MASLKFMDSSLANSSGFQSLNFGSSESDILDCIDIEGQQETFQLPSSTPSANIRWHPMGAPLSQVNPSSNSTNSSSNNPASAMGCNLAFAPQQQQQQAMSMLTQPFTFQQLWAQMQTQGIPWNPWLLPPFPGNPYMNPSMFFPGFPNPFTQTGSQQTVSSSTAQPVQSAPDGKNQTMYRNLFHQVICKFAGKETAVYEDCRVYIADSVGYSGNAKRFKKLPEQGEKALLLNCLVLDPKDNPLVQCLACKDYFDSQKYFKANPECVGRLVLVKNNTPIKVDGGQFKILCKMMCCCIHHSVEHFQFQLTLTDAATERVVHSSRIPLSVKQWRKSNQKKEDCILVLSECT